MNRRLGSLFAALAAAVVLCSASARADEEPVNLDNPEKAAKRFEKEVEKAPDDFRNHYNLGLAYLKLKKWPEAEAALKKAVELNPESASSHAALGSAQVKAGKKDEAVASYETALKLDSTRLDVQQNLADAYLDAGRHDQAIEVYKAALKNKPADPSGFYNNIGVAYLKKGDPESAIKWFERNIELAPDSPTTYYNLGQVYLKVANETQSPEVYKKAAETLVKAAEMDRNNLVGLVLAGEALVMAGRKAEGLAYFDRYLAADPGGKKAGAKVHELASAYKKELSE